ncbi:MAG: hypothetical protein ACLPUH_09540 [Steroidobacteraceae bacterium]
MSTFIGNMKLYLLLGVTLLLLRKAQKDSARVRTLMQENSFIFQIQTVGGAGGHFTLRDGRLSLTQGLHANPDFAQIWASGHDALRTLTSSDETDMLRAFDAGRCRMRGNFLIALWFNEVLKLARKRGSTLPSVFLASSKG